MVLRMEKHPGLEYTCSSRGAVPAIRCEMTGTRDFSIKGTLARSWFAQAIRITWLLGINLVSSPCPRLIHASILPVSTLESSVNFNRQRKFATNFTTYVYTVSARYDRLPTGLYLHLDSALLAADALSRISRRIREFHLHAT